MEKLETKLKLADLSSLQNIATRLSDDDLMKIGFRVVEDYETDKQSRSSWEAKMKQANKLALQIVEQKSTPWEGASNVKFPLLTIASLQFASRAYPALVKAPDLVKFRVQGRDPEGAKAARAGRISAHMSYQLLEQDEQWEEQHDRAFIALPILGCVFKKSYFDPVKGHNCSKTVLPMDLVVHYYAKSLEECERKTEVFQSSERIIRERQLKGLYVEHDLPPATQDTEAQADERQGTTPPANDTNRPRTILEQHAYLDLDGDGYPEPYVLTVDKESRKVFRIVNRFGEVVTEQSLKVDQLKVQIKDIATSLPQEGSEENLIAANRAEQTITMLKTQIERFELQAPKVLRIKAVEYYTKIPFIPAPDGGFYDLGFGALLGPLNDSVDTLINQLIDSGSLQNGSVGFIGKGARIKGGKVRFSPNEWKRVDVAGPTLRDALVPLPVNAPSPVLFNLLGLLIQYTERVSSVTEAMSGENPGQNTPAYNMSAMLEQGLQVFNGIFKRVYRSFRSELRKLYALNAIYLDEEEYFEYQDGDGNAYREDYKADVKDLVPAADPNAFSNKEKQMKAQMIAERSMMVPGYDKIKVEQRLLESMDVPDAAELFPTQQNQETGAIELVFQPGPDPEFQIKQLEEQRRTLDSQQKFQLEAQLTEAKIALIEVQIIEVMARAELAADTPELKRMELALDEMKDRRKNLLEMAKIDEERTARADKSVDGKPDNG